MFIEIKSNNTFISHDASTIEKLENDFLINLSCINQIEISSGLMEKKLGSESIKLEHKIQFYIFVEEGLWNYLTILFQKSEVSEFKRIKNIINQNTMQEENNMSNNNNDKANQKNANEGTSGTNKSYDKVQGNRGKQMNPNNITQKGK